MSKTPTLSICIPTYNRADLLEYCLEQLRALDTTGLDYEVVVLNHASTDHTATVLEKAVKRWSNLRVYHQTRQVYLGGQLIAALRLARGEFVMALADDDKIIPNQLAEYVRQMQASPNVVVTYTPWLAYDDTTEKVLHGYFTVPAKRSFHAGEVFELFKFMAEQQIYPEIAIYRNSALQQVSFSYDGAPLHNFIWCVELAKHGEIVFQPEPFYYEVAAVKPQFARTTRINIDMTLTYLDHMRAGIEVMVMRIIHASGGGMVSPEARMGIHEVLLNYLLARLIVAFNRSMIIGDYLSASGLAQRIMLWRGAFREDLEKQAMQALLGAGVQQVGWLLHSMSWKEELVVYGITKTELIRNILNMRYPEIKVRFLDEATIREEVDPEMALLMVRDSQQKAAFAGMFLPGHIISLEETIAYNKFYPLNVSLADA